MVFRKLTRDLQHWDILRVNPGRGNLLWGAGVGCVGSPIAVGVDRSSPPGSWREQWLLLEPLSSYKVNYCSVHKAHTKDLASLNRNGLSRVFTLLDNVQINNGGRRELKQCNSTWKRYSNGIDNRPLINPNKAHIL